jgi:hypothetical protein
LPPPAWQLTAIFSRSRTGRNVLNISEVDLDFQAKCLEMSSDPAVPNET